jgi:hypothetical protein
MADKKISALDAIVAIDDADVLPIVDASVSTTKKINVSQVKALAPVQSVASKTGAVTLVKGDVGLGNVDNTADADKPVSTATQTALNAKQDTLVSGTNIKTINDESILGSGNITISGGGGITDGDKGDITVSASGATWTIDNGVVTDAKVASGIDAAKIADGSVSNAEYQYLGGVTSDIQTQLNAKEATISAGTTGQYYRGDKSFQTLDKTAVGLGNVDNTSDANKPVSTATQTALDGKQATITGAATTIDTEDLTASRALVSDGSGKVAVSDVTTTELGYLDGVTSAVQTQVDAKTAKLITTNRQTASYTLVLSDADKLVEMNVATANDLTIPLNSSVAFATGTQILVAQYGAGQTTVVATSGVNVRSNGGKLKLNVQYSGATLIKIATDEWYLFGDIVA